MPPGFLTSEAIFLSLWRDLPMLKKIISAVIIAIADVLRGTKKF